MLLVKSIRLDDGIILADVTALEPVVDDTKLSIELDDTPEVASLICVDISEGVGVHGITMVLEDSPGGGLLKADGNTEEPEAVDDIKTIGLDETNEFVDTADVETALVDWAE